MSTRTTSDRTVDPEHRGAQSRARIALGVAGLLLLATACGSEGESPGAAAAGEAAGENVDTLEINSDVRLTEVLAVDDGSIQTLQDAVDGDRPVLLWFWAPH